MSSPPVEYQTPSPSLVERSSRDPGRNITTGTRALIRCRPPSFINLAPMSGMLKGALLADLIPTFDFINMIGGECDR